jgi:hypothetical protein
MNHGSFVMIWLFKNNCYESDEKENKKRWSWIDNNGFLCWIWWENRWFFNMFLVWQLLCDYGIYLNTIFDIIASERMVFWTILNPKMNKIILNTGLNKKKHLNADTKWIVLIIRSNSVFEIIEIISKTYCILSSQLADDECDWMSILFFFKKLV